MFDGADPGFHATYTYRARVPAADIEPVVDVQRARAERLEKALRDIWETIDGMADTEDVPDSAEVRPNIFMRIDQIIDGVL